MSNPQDRANMPKDTHQILDRRSVQNANKNLLGLIQPGMKILDVGCGSGSITKSIAHLVGPKGKVAGLDPSENLILQAKEKFGNVQNLEFVRGNLFDFDTTEKFDLVTAARVIQWLDNPKQAIETMMRFVKEGGIISILDYNHCKIHFEPEIPKSVQYFYDRFLQWRLDAGFDNEIADHLVDIFETLGLKNLQVESFNELSIKGSGHFENEIVLWKKVAETRGHQMVNDSYITEEERLQAAGDYQVWMDDEAQKMELYLRSVTGRK